MSGQFKKGIFVAVAVIMLSVAVLAIVQDGGADASSDDDVNASYMQFAAGSDLADQLDNASSGQTVTMTGDSALSRYATVKSDVILDTNGYALTIPNNIILQVDGQMRVSGNFNIGAGSSLIVASAGRVIIDNNNGTTTLEGSIEVLENGRMEIGHFTASNLKSLGNSKIVVDGVLDLGIGGFATDAEILNIVVTGKMTMSATSNLRVIGSFVLGNPPSLTTELKNPASFTGKITLDNGAYALVYGESSFNQNDNIRYTAVNSQFILNGKAYATEYMASTGNKALILPDVYDLRDNVVKSWRDSEGNVIPDKPTAYIGSATYKTIDAEVQKRTYTVVLTDDPSIRWIVNGIVKSSSESEDFAYGAKITIDIRSASGAALPTLKVNGAAYTPGTVLTVTNNMTFTTSNNVAAKDDGNTDTVILILIAVIIIAAAVLAFAYFRFLKNKNKSK